MNPMYIEETTIRMPRHHLSLQDVARIAAQFVERRSSIHPKYEPKSSFVIVVFSEDTDGLAIGEMVAHRVPTYLTFDINAMYQKNFAELDDAKGRMLTPRQLLQNADVILEVGVDYPEIKELELNPTRLHLKVVYDEELVDGDV